MADYGARGWPRTVGHDPHSTRGKCWSHHSARCVRWQMTGPGGGLGLWATTLINTGEMLVSSFCTSRPRDATRRMSATELVLRSSVAAALHPSTQLAVSSSRPSRRLEEGRGGTSRRDASCAQHQLRRSSISSVTAAAAGDGSVPRRRAVDGALLSNCSHTRSSSSSTSNNQQYEYEYEYYKRPLLEMAAMVCTVGRA